MTAFFLWACLMTAAVRPVSDMAPSPGDSLTVYVFLHSDCVISRAMTPELNRLQQLWSGQPVGMVGYFPHPGIRQEEVTAFASEFGLSFPMRIDTAQVHARALGITVMPEAAVVDHRTDRILYRGRIDDSYARVGKRRLHANEKDLEKWVGQWLEGTPPAGTVYTRAIGCFLTFTNSPTHK